MKQGTKQNPPTLQLRLAALSIGLALSQSALATPGQTQLSVVQGWMLAIGGFIVTIAVMVVGFKMMYQKIPFHECSHVLWGGILVGSATAIGGTLIAGG